MEHSFTCRLISGQLPDIVNNEQPTYSPGGVPGAKNESQKDRAVQEYVYAIVNSDAIKPWLLQDKNRCCLYA